MALDVTKAEQLLKAFAEMNPMTGNNECDTYCTLCYADFDYEHEESCAWRQAREMFGLPLPQKPEPVEVTVHAKFLAEVWTPQILEALRQKIQVVKTDESDSRL